MIEDKDKYRDYLMKCLAEECSELIFILIKADRFGLEATGLDGIKYDNKFQIEKEFNDILAIVDLINEYGFSLVRNEGMIVDKRFKVLRHFQHSINLGRI